MNSLFTFMALTVGSFEVNIPKQFQSTNHRLAFEIIKAQADYNHTLAEGGPQASALIADPCALYNRIQPLRAYPPADHSKSFFNRENQDIYNRAFEAAEMVVKSVEEQNADLNYKCSRP